MEDRLKEVIISITSRCNLKCAMCQIPQSQDNGEMSTQEIRGLIKDAVSLSPNSIVFSGGEPLLRDDIFELIAFTNQQRINTCLASNGTLIDDRAAVRLREAGIGVVNISIEGPEEIHDSLRGKGTFQKALRALENLAQNRIEATVAMVVCRQNYESLPFVMELAQKFKATTVKFQPFSVIFLKNKEAKKNFFASRGLLRPIQQRIEDAIELSEKYRIATNPVDYLRSIPAYLCGLQQGRSQTSCSALKSSCPVSAEGNVYLCWVLSDIVLGNLRRNKLSEIWNSDRHNQLRHSVVKKGCSGCLMSCYDYNFGKYGLQKTISFKAQKLKKIKFYKRQYFRVYQYARYISGKIINRIVYLVIRPKRNNSNISKSLNEIKIARNLLKENLRKLRKNE